MKDASSGLAGRDVRRHNLVLVLRHLADAGTASRAELAAATGLVPGAISLLVSELRDAGLVRPVGKRSHAPAARGRRTEELELDGTRIGVVAVQVGLDEMRVHAADLGGRVALRDVRTAPTPVGDPGAVADLVAERLREGVGALAGAGARVVAVEVVVPAPVEVESGRVPMAVDLGWRDVDLPQLLVARVPEVRGLVTVRNDAKSALRAEHDALRRRLAGEDVHDLVYLKADTGIGGGAVVDGRPLRGATGRTFEPGHMVVAPDGPPCACGRRGCLVTVAGPQVLVDAAGLGDVRRGAGLSAALRELTVRLAAGEPVARGAVDDAARWLRQAITTICVLLSPQVVVLGGYLAELAPLLGDLDDGVLSRLGVGPLRGRDAVLASLAGPAAAVDGAVLLARAELLAHPERWRADA